MNKKKCVHCGYKFKPKDESEEICDSCKFQMKGCSESKKENDIIGLEEDETVILDEGLIGFRKKLVLTNKRLFEYKGKGVFTVKWVIEKQIPLSEIEEATQEMETFTSMVTLVLKMKDETKISYQLKLSDSQLLSAQLGGGDMIIVKVKAITDKYVTAINHQITKTDKLNPLDILKLRLAKGEITKEEYEELKQILKG